jgi:hypothetical protein
MKQIIMVFGVPRTGTTWAFNVAKGLLQQAGEPYCSGFANDPPVAWATSPTVLLKTHKPWRPSLFAELMQHRAAHLIFTVRNAEDTILSLYRVMRDQLPSADRMEVLTLLHQRYLALEAYFAHLPRFVVVDEGEIATRPVEICRAIGDYCGIRTDEATLKEVANRLRKEQVAVAIDAMAGARQWQRAFGDYDDATQWHANHVSQQGYSYDWSAQESRRLDDINQVIASIKRAAAEKDTPVHREGHVSERIRQYLHSTLGEDDRASWY